MVQDLDWWLYEPVTLSKLQAFLLYLELMIRAAENVAGTGSRILYRHWCMELEEKYRMRASCNNRLYKLVSGNYDITMCA